MISSRRQSRGFTLLEMMVVIALIGLVSAIVAVSVVHIYDEARADATGNQLLATQAALKTFYVKKGQYPARLEELVESGVTDELPADAWKKPLQYRVVNGKPVVSSAGKDHEHGTEDDLVK